jgi:hypothetical protein
MAHIHFTATIKEKHLVAPGNPDLNSYAKPTTITLVASRVDNLDS